MRLKKPRPYLLDSMQQLKLLNFIEFFDVVDLVLVAEVMELVVLLKVIEIVEFSKVFKSFQLPDLLMWNFAVFVKDGVFFLEVDNFFETFQAVLAAPVAEVVELVR